jgi:hypothetical protein
MYMSLVGIEVCYNLFLFFNKLLETYLSLTILNCYVSTSSLTNLI